MARLPTDGAHGREDGGARVTATVNQALRSDVRRVGDEEDAEASAPLRRRGPRPGGSSWRDPSLADIAWIVFDRRWTVVAMTALALAAGAFYLAVTPKTYHSSILIQVEGRSRPVAAFQDLATLFQESTPTEGEMRIMKSRTLLEAVVRELNLLVEASPRRAPFIGSVFARRWNGEEPAPARFGLARYGWGGERIRVERLEVEPALVGEPLVLTALEDGRYRVETSEGAPLGEGEIGKLVKMGDDRVELLVAELTARPGTEFILLRRHLIDVIESLQAALRIVEQGRQTGLVEVSLSGGDPARIAAILDSVSSNYRRQSVERTSAEAAKTLAVLEAQLPILKTNLDKAERALNEFHRKHGTVNLSLGGEDLLRRLSEVDRQLAEADVLAGELSNRLTDKHWQLTDLAERTRRLQAQRAALEARLRELPRLELESMRLSRQLRVATELYMLVLNRAEELRIVKSGWIGNARVLEQAVAPRRPVGPKPRLVFVLAMLFGVGGGVALALLRNAFDRTVKDPDEVEVGLGLPVMATIPRSSGQRKIGRRTRRKPVLPLALVNPLDPAIEELRGLRTSVQFALLRSRNNVIAIGGLAPKAGKSFVSVNLAHLLAAAEGRVLLVDGDLRRGGLHRWFGIEPQPGLVEVLEGKARLEEVVRATLTPNLELLPAGRLPSNPAELLAGSAFEELVAELGRRYRIILIDTPPILSVTDSALVARLAGVNLLVLRAGMHSPGEMLAALRRLGQSGVTIRGVILNDVRPVWSRYGRTGVYHRYELVRRERELN